MKIKIRAMLVIFLLLYGCSKVGYRIFPLDFSQVNKIVVSNLSKSNLREVVQERKIDNDTSVFIFKNQDSGEISGGINLNEEYFYIGEVSMGDTPEDLMGIVEVSVFGKKAVKVYGILGSNYAHAYYWLYEDGFEDSIIRVDGNSIEIDLDDDGIEEIVSELGTAPQMTIYKMEERKIKVSNINESINARAVSLRNIDENIFEVYFRPNKPELYFYKNDSLKKLSR